MGTTRYVYNKALSKVKSGEDKVNFYDLRNKYVTKGELVNDWELETPKDIRAGALKDLVASYKSGFTKLKQRQITHFSMNYRTRKKETSIEIPNSAIKLDKKHRKITLYSRYLSAIKLSNDKCLGTLEINHACRLKLEGRKWFLMIPVKVVVSEMEPKRDWCSLDPGVCNFQTMYSEESTLKVQVNKELLQKLQDKLDLFQSLRTKKIITYHHFKRRQRKLYETVTNLVDDIHYKLIQYLTTNYQNIFLPTFESQEIVRKMKGSRNRRTLLSLKHFKFKERLKSKCSRMKHSAVYDCTEEYTSKTCTVCGKIKYDLGIQRIFECDDCGTRIDRDINGARNIGIKILMEH